MRFFIVCVCVFSLQPSVPSPILDLNILYIVFSDVLNLCSSLNAKKKVSHQYKTKEQL